MLYILPVKGMKRVYNHRSIGTWLRKWIREEVRSYERGIKCI